MRRFKSIAVLLSQKLEDGPILERAVQLAKQNGARLSVYAPYEKPPAYVAEMDHDESLRSDVFEHEERIREEELEALVSSVQKTWLATRGKLLVGKTFVDVIHEVLENGHDLLMMPAEKRKKRWAGLFFGGPAMHLLRKCPCAVWVFRSERKRSFRKIMAAVNVTADRREEMEMNLKILELATSLARQEGAALYIVHCWTSPVESIPARTGGLSVADRRRFVQESRKRVRRLLQTYLGKVEIDAETTEVHTPKGEAGELIPSLATEWGIELIVMGTVARSGIPGFIIGNTAEEILNRVPCSVLAVKPSGFVSPVTLETYEGSLK